MRASSLLCLFLLTGCDHAKATTGPSAVAVPAVTQPAAACVLFDADLSIDVHLAKPSQFHSSRLIRGSSVIGGEYAEFQDFFHSPVMHFASLATLNAGTYRIRVDVGGCWSREQAFTITANPNASGEVVPQKTPTPTQRQHYSQTRCVQAKSMVAGISEVLTFNAPAGSYRVTATTWDKFHKAGYQVGQVETAIVSGFGVTEDIGDLETSHSTVWTTRLPIGEIRVTGNQGSLHGDSGAVCVTVEEL